MFGEFQGEYPAALCYIRSSKMITRRSRHGCTCGMSRSLDLRCVAGAVHRQCARKSQLHVALFPGRCERLYCELGCSWLFVVSFRLGSRRLALSPRDPFCSVAEDRPVRGCGVTAMYHGNMPNCFCSFGRNLLSALQPISYCFARLAVGERCCDGRARGDAADTIGDGCLGRFCHDMVRKQGKPSAKNCK